MSDLDERNRSGAGTLVPRRDSIGSRTAPSARLSDIAVEATINDLFSVGLTITAARSLIDGEAGDRLDQAVDALDALIAELRSRTH